MDLDFAWGDTICVRQALTEVVGRSIVHNVGLLDLSYPSHTGDPELVDMLKKVAYNQSGFNFKHLYVTNGCTGALNVAIAALKTDETFMGVIRPLHFPFYPSIVAQQGLLCVKSGDLNPRASYSGFLTQKNYITIADSPSNPVGEGYKGECDIWDAAYATKKYGGGKESCPESFKIMCGSLSKTLGLNGLRLGWVATNDDLLGEKLAQIVTCQYCGISQSQTFIAKRVLKKLDKGGWDDFENLAYKKINANRGEWRKVLDQFGLPVCEKGMFQVFEPDVRLRAAMMMSGVKWQSGLSFGGNEWLVRISMGQTNEITKKAVKLVLENLNGR
jgi:aspartate/methionine/tyrosine aminotransferase